MRPLLFDENETVFTSHGIGPISEATDCTVTEEGNGAFELTLTLPVTSRRLPELAYRRQILAQPNPYDRTQPFRIYRVTRPLRGAVTVFARHVSYDLNGVVIAPLTASTAGLACAAINGGALTPNPFTFNTDMTNVAGELTTTVPTAARSLLGPVDREDTLLHVYGGDLRFDRYDVTLLQKRGADRGFSIVYGVNMTELNADGNAGEVYTGILPYWTDGETLVQGAVQSLAGSAGYSSVRPVDLSGEFAEQPSVAELNAHGAAYVARNKIGVPEESFRVSFVPPGARGLKTLEELQLFDEVTVRYERLGVDVKRTVVKTSYDVLRERYKSVEIGERRVYIAETIAAPVTAKKLAPGSVGGGALSKRVKKELKDAKDTAVDAKATGVAANTLASTANRNATEAKDAAATAYNVAAAASTAANEAKDIAGTAANSVSLINYRIKHASSFDELKDMTP